jgi:hypothetical protein
LPLVKATLRRWKLCKKPTSPLALARTNEINTTSLSEPWKESTVATLMRARPRTATVPLTPGAPPKFRATSATIRCSNNACAL